jgi:putative Holliday junction resolvase
MLGVDPGTRRVGLALADEASGVAVPLEVVDVAATDPVARIARLVAERDVTLVVVGRPVGLRGRDGPAVAQQQELVARLRARLDVEVTEFDERLTTAAAERSLRAAGAPRSARRRVVDALAAQTMLQGFLDRRKA